jgi:hypothetical protein
MIENITPTRHYNSLIDKGDYFIKSSVDIDKIAAEIQYYENLPQTLKRFYPKYLGRTDQGNWPTGYKIEKIPENDISLFFINRIQDQDNYFSVLFSLINEYINVIPKKKVTKDEYLNSLDQQIFQRDIKRIHSLKFTPLYDDVLKIFSNRGFEDLTDFRIRLHDKISKLTSRNKSIETWYTHGDLCFSNMIIHNKELKLIDPRGIYSTTDAAHLVPYYDLSKLSQCIYGGYDFINHEISIDIQHSFDKEFKSLINNSGLNLEECRLIEASHFLAMLPLHINNKNKVLNFANKAIDVFEEAS